MDISDIRIRDPFIVSDLSEKQYYLFGTTDLNTWKGKATGFDCYISKDLQNWSDPIPAFRPSRDFWADENFWAPEVYHIRNKWYMVASFKSADRSRGVQILSSDKPYGPYFPLTDFPVTPQDWECLDGTLYTEGNTVWLIFSHEWQQITDGEICAIRLTDDLTGTVGQPETLFSASQAPWTVAETGPVQTETGGYVTDGPWLFWGKDNRLHMLWSSFSKSGYSIGLAHSSSNTVTGSWYQDEKPLFNKDGGHGMIFRTFDGKAKLVIHSPNIYLEERVKIIDVSDLA